MNGETRKVVPERRRRGGHGRGVGQARNHDLDFWRNRQTLAISPKFKIMMSRLSPIAALIS